MLLDRTWSLIEEVIDEETLRRTATLGRVTVWGVVSCVCALRFTSLGVTGVVCLCRVGGTGHFIEERENGHFLIGYHSMNSVAKSTKISSEMLRRDTHNIA